MWPPVVKPPDSIASKFPSAPSPSPTVTVTQFVLGWQVSTSLVSRHGLLFQAATPFCISATQSAGTYLVSKVMTTLAAPFRLQGTWESSGSWSCKAAPAGATQASADDGEGEEVGDGDEVGEAAAGLVCAGVTEGASAEVGPGSGESADVHDTSAESARTSATASRPVRRTMLPNLPPDISTRAGFDQPALLPQGAVGAHCTPGGGSRGRLSGELRNGGIHGGTAEDLVGHHGRRSGDARPVPQPARRDPQMRGRQRLAAAQQRLAYAVKEVLVGVDDVPADDHDIGIEQADRGRQHVAEGTTRGGHHPHRVRVAQPDQVDHVPGGDRRVPQPLQVPHHRPAAGDGGEAAARPAAAAGLGDPGDLGVSDVALGRVGAPQQLAVDDDRGADPGTDLDEEHQVRGRVDPALLAQPEQVRVVVDHSGYPEVVPQVVA